ANYSYLFKPAGGSGSYTITTSSLPAGFSFNASTYVLSAPSPSSAGTSNITLTVADSAGGASFTYTYSLTVNAFAITDAAVLPQATLNTPYSHAFQAPGCVS